MFRQKKNLKKGFTLVELLVTISIFVILTGVVLFSQSRFNGSILLTNLAYDTALTVRQAQTYGINVKEFNTGSGALDASKFVPYGVHFDTVNNKSFILFADVLYDKLSDPNSHPYKGDILSVCQTDKGCVNRYNIKQGNYISNICMMNTSGGCDSINTQSLDVLFQRPNPDALIYINGILSTSNKVIISLKSSDGSVRKVSVQSNGLIEVSNN